MLTDETKKKLEEAIMAAYIEYVTMLLEQDPTLRRVFEIPDEEEDKDEDDDEYFTHHPRWPGDHEYQDGYTSSRY